MSTILTSSDELANNYPKALTGEELANAEYQARKNSADYQRRREAELRDEARPRPRLERPAVPSRKPVAETEEIARLRAQLAALQAEQEAITERIAQEGRRIVAERINTVFTVRDSDRRRLIELGAEMEEVRLRLKREIEGK